MKADNGKNRQRIGPIVPRIDSGKADTGRFELTDKGTIFLDEIGELPLSGQARLLRVLQEGQFERVGGTTTLDVDVRVIAATNRDIGKMVDEGRFREDLYYRLNVVPILSPPLRQRRGDILQLTQHFVARFSKSLGRTQPNVPDSLVAQLEKYDWPGNIRELQNVTERATILSKGDELSLPPGSLPEHQNFHETMANRNSGLLSQRSWT